MSRVDGASLPGPAVRTMQILIVACTVGLVVFLGIVLFLRQRPKPAPPPPAAGPEEEPPLISYAACAFALIAVPMSLLVPALVVKNERKAIAQGTWAPAAPLQSAGTLAPDSPDSWSGLAMLYQRALIIGAALTEGPAFFAVLAYMLEGRPAILGMAVLLILAVAARFPTRARVERWLEVQEERLIEEKMAGG